MKKISSFILAVFTTMALSIRVNGAGLRDLIFAIKQKDIVIQQVEMIKNCWREASLLSILLIVLFYFLYLKIMNYECKRTNLIFSVVSGAATSLGVSYTINNSWDLLTIPVTAIVTIIGFSSLFYLIVNIMLEWLSNNAVITKTVPDNSLGKYWIIIVLCWLPYYIVYFPGNLFPDGMDQLNKFFGFGIWTKHHPPLSTMLMGWAIRLGRIMHSDNIGLFIYVTLQFLVLSYAFAKAMQFISRLGVSRKFSIGALTFYALFTVWPCYAVCMIKDTIFVVAVTLFFIVLCEVLILRVSFDYRAMLRLILWGTAVCMLRNNGLYLVVGAVPIIFLLRGGIKRKLFAVVSIFSIYFVCNILVFPAMGISKGGTQEALSIPFQQTARYVSQYSDEVTEYEREVIDGVLDYERIRDGYNPDVSDAVKGTYHWAYDAATTQEGESEALKKYFEIWWKMFLKHPGCYIQATLNNIYQYFYIDATSLYSNVGYYSITNDPTVDLGEFNFSYLFSFEWLRYFIESISEVMRRFPAIGVLYGTGIYDIMFLFVFLYFVGRKELKKVMLMLPFVVLVLTCLASPVNGAVRYLLPLMACLPVIFAIFIKDYCEIFGLNKRNGVYE